MKTPVLAAPAARAAAFVSAPQPEGTTQRLSCQLHHQKGTTANAPPSSVAPTHHTKAAQLLCMRVRVSAVWQDAWVIPMHDVVDLVFCEQLIDEVWGQVVGHVCADMHKQMHTRSGMTQEDESFQPLWVKKFACCTRHPCISAPAQGFRGIFYCCELMKAIESNFFNGEGRLRTKQATRTRTLALTPIHIRVCLHASFHYAQYSFAMHTPVMTSSTHFTDDTRAKRSSSFSTGGPLQRRISLSGIRPTTS